MNRVSPGRFRPLRALFAMFMFLSVCRVGEARVPGPTAEPWSLGICNPSGLQGKHHVLSQVDATVLAISETHLSSLAKKNLTSSFKSLQSKYKHVITGAPMAPRTTTSDAGQWAGVAFTSTVPCRSLATH